MVIVAVVAIWVGLFSLAFIAYRIADQRSRAPSRFAEAIEAMTAADSSTGRNRTLSDEANASSMTLLGQRASEAKVLEARRLSRRWIWVPYAFSGLVATCLFLFTPLTIQYIIAITSVICLLAIQLEGFLAARVVAKLESQLADAIDIMVGGLAAGAAVGPAMESAKQELDAPLKPYLEEVTGRIRLGDDPISVFRTLAERVPLETFLLFSSALSVHWEVGGRLAPTLATVGRTIRDRIEVTRRIQSNIAQSQFSTFAILGLIYLIAFIVWRNGPEPMEEFVTSTVGSWFVAGSIMMQAVGILWMNWISRPRF